MFVHFTRYATALVVLCGLAGVYELTLVPVLEPPPMEAVVIQPAALMTRSPLIDQLFPEGSWQRQAPRRLKTDAGYLLFSHREQVATDRWRVWPVTVIVGDTERPPVVMDAPDGAEIAFSEPLDVLSRGAPPIESGQLRGKVSIRTMGRGTDDPVPVADQLEIMATDVGIDRRRIWTHEAIRLRWGKMVLAGRNLTLNLAGGGGIPTDGEASPLSILDSMQLVYLDELTIPLAATGLFGKEEDAAGAGPEATDQAKLTVQCEGTVSFDFATDTLDLRNRVRLEHHAPGQPPDTIACRRLRVKFNNPLASHLPRETAGDWLRTIEASGEPVVAKLPTVQSEAAAEQVTYDAAARRFRMHGPGGVRISYRGMHLKTTEFDYQMSEAGPEAIGTLEAAGSGILSLPAEGQAGLRRLRWSKGVQLRPGEGAGRHELLVNGDVRAAMLDGGAIEADGLVFRFRQEPSSAASGELPAQESATGFAGLVPENAQASGNVTLDTSTLFTKTEQLQLFFHVQPPKKDAGEDEVALNPAAGEPLRFWVRPPAAESEAETPSTQPVARPIPKLFGNTVSAQLSLRDQQLIGGDVSVEGEVRLEHEMVTEQGVLPVVATGEQLRIIQEEGKQRVHIRGGEAPAKFDLGDGFFVGPLIEVNVRENYVWIKDGGSFRMPSAVLPTGDPQAKVRWATPPQCDWSGEMLFDGHEIELNGGVRLSAEMQVGAEQTPWNVAATGERLRLRLDQEVRIADPDRARAAAIQDLALFGDQEHPVYLTADETDADGKLQTRHVLSAPLLTVLPATGGLVGEGPGWYRQWSVSDGTGAMAKFSPRGSLVGMHLTFEKEMVGQLQNRRLDFVQGVQIALSPVERWEELLDVEQMQTLRPGQATIACDRLSFVQSPQTAGRASAPAAATAEAAASDKPAAWEMLTEGGVLFRARNDRGLFEVTAARASYAAIKDLFVVEGDGRRPARYQHTYPTGLPGPKLDLIYLAVRPRTMEVVDSVLQGASIGTLPAGRQPR